jgi:hypothetical protein
LHRFFCTAPPRPLGFEVCMPGHLCSSRSAAEGDEPDEEIDAVSGP